MKHTSGPDNSASDRSAVAHAHATMPAPTWRTPIRYVQAVLARIPEKIRHPVMDVCGVLCLIMPLFIYASLELWVAKVIVVAGAIAFAVLIVRVWSYPHNEF